MATRMGIVGAPQGGFLYDSNQYSTPLSLLQLPQAVLPQVTQQLTEPGNTTVRFTHDGKTLSDYKSLVSAIDLQHVAEVNVDLGFACKKCQMVYPSEILCLNHQKSSCYVTKAIKDIKATLKLVQILLECGACRERFATIPELRVHCNLERHVKRVQRENMTIPPVPSNMSALVTPSTIVPPMMGACFASVPPVLEGSSTILPSAIGESSATDPSFLVGSNTLSHALLQGSFLPTTTTTGGMQLPISSVNQPPPSNQTNNSSPIIFEQLDAQVELDSLTMEQGQES